MLTETVVRAAEPREKAYKLFDTGGLFVIVNPDGTRWWRFKYLYGEKEDLSKLAKVAKSSVRFDDAIPAAMAERLREIANIANLVAEYFNGDAGKVSLWFELPNPMLGHVSPAVMIRGNRCRRLLNFVLEAREAEMGSLDMARKRA